MASGETPADERLEMATIDIYLKSGSKITLKSGGDFAVTHSGGRITTVRWGAGCQPNPLFIEPAQIEAVIER